ncbi:DUF429 domain-containing protein [Rhodoferax sp.]|uniref:DUF429 domain-containing protein n=1 Tax=Rhodoferax sp. TaxID=50421 RepID=UPI0026063323|nr:DUF429 domain-containing protein [Rhodoferax sp.]MDD2920149.1 DUF429 domain-containing protein [Rhodoferax sp.]
MPASVLLGCDFSSAPTTRKPVVLAFGTLHSGRVRLASLERFATLAGFSDRLKQMPAWVGAFDLPFGLPRELVQTLGWPTDWAACVAHYTRLSRDQIRLAFAAFCMARPVGGKFAHRATDRPAGSSPSMKWVNPPVAFMLHAGVPLLLQAGATMPGLHAGNNQKIALEAYPGMLAREVLGQRSYKADDKARQTSERLIARKDLITALEQGNTRLCLRLKLSHAQRDALADDARGDALDAVLCLMQAAWAQTQQDAGAACYGLPLDLDPLEGWIVSA